MLEKGIVDVKVKAAPYVQQYVTAQTVWKSPVIAAAQVVGGAIVNNHSENTTQSSTANMWSSTKPTQNTFSSGSPAIHTLGPWNYNRNESGAPAGKSSYNQFTAVFNPTPDPQKTTYNPPSGNGDTGGNTYIYNYTPPGTGYNDSGSYNIDYNGISGGEYHTPYGSGAGGNPASIGAAGMAGAWQSVGGGFADFLGYMGAGMGSGFNAIGQGYGGGISNALSSVGEGIKGGILPAILVGGAVILVLGLVAEPKRL